MDDDIPLNRLHYDNIYTKVENSLTIEIKEQSKFLQIAKEQTAEWSPNTTLAITQDETIDLTDDTPTANTTTTTSTPSSKLQPNLDIDSSHMIYTESNEYEIDITKSSTQHQRHHINTMKSTTTTTPITATTTTPTDFTNHSTDATSTTTTTATTNDATTMTNDATTMGTNATPSDTFNNTSRTTNNATPTTTTTMSDVDGIPTDISSTDDKLSIITLPPPTQQQIEHFNQHPIFDVIGEHDKKYIQTIALQLATHQSTAEYNIFSPFTDANNTQSIGYLDYNREVYNIMLSTPQQQSQDGSNTTTSTTTRTTSTQLQQQQQKQQQVQKKSPLPPHLSLFQSHGIAAILHNHHLLVTAHTGSGKTVAAHALILHHLARGPKAKIVYTTPIKALSNQKYAELSRLYPDVGLLTGDVTLNPDATIVVMTTEILRNKSIHVDSPYTAAIFDEVHYMEDASRGVIWEETLLTLPLSTQMVFLSATVENGDEFAKWISKVTQRPCHIVNTRVRAVPIAHILLDTVSNQPGIAIPPYESDKATRGKLLTDAGIDIYSKNHTHWNVHAIHKNTSTTSNNNNDDDDDIMIVSSNIDQFQSLMNNDDNTTAQKQQQKQFPDEKKLLSTLTQFRTTPSTIHAPYPLTTYSYHVQLPSVDPTQEIPTDLQGPPPVVLQYQIISAILTAIQNHWLPMISFSFVRKDCDLYGKLLYRMGFCVTTPKQQLQIIQFCQEHFENDIPDRSDIIQQLSMGIGVHHSGQISRVREVVEMLLEQGLIKILFATETFAVGINVPVRSVIFSNISKWDGTKHRLLNPSEYTQMSGRAGRRGMDRVGISIVLNDRNLTPILYRQVVCGGSLCLESRFRVSIGLLLSSFTSGARTNQLSTITSRVVSNNDTKQDGKNKLLSTTTSSTTTSSTPSLQNLLQFSMGNNRGYSLQQVIESSFAIFRFTNSKVSAATAMLTRAILLFTQLIYRLYLSTRTNPIQLERFKPWINIEEVVHKIGLPTLQSISTMNIATYKMISLVLDEKGYLAINNDINIAKIAFIIFNPTLLFPLYIQSLCLLAHESLLPYKQYSSIEWLERFYQYEQNKQYSHPLSFYGLYTTVLSLLDPLSNDVLTFQQFGNYSTNEFEESKLITKQFLHAQSLQSLSTSDTNTTTTTTTTNVETPNDDHPNIDLTLDTIITKENEQQQQSKSTKITRSTASLDKTYYNSQLDTLSNENEQGSNLYLLSDKPDPNDIASYLIPGRIIHIDFPTEFHDHTHNNKQYHLNQLLSNYNNNYNNDNPNDITEGLRIPQTIGWGVVLDVRTQYTTSLLIDVLVTLPIYNTNVSISTRKNTTTTTNTINNTIERIKGYELHVITICECAVSRISSLCISLPDQMPFNNNKALIAVWFVLKQTADAWKNYPNNHLTPPKSNPSKSNKIYQLPNGLTPNTNVNNFDKIISSIHYNDIVSVYHSTSFPLIYARRSNNQTNHTVTIHRAPCTLIDLPKIQSTSSSTTTITPTQSIVATNWDDIGNNNNNITTTSLSQMNNITHPFQYSSKYLSVILTSLLESYPPPLRMMLKLFLDAQSCWLSSKTDSFVHTMQLATTSYNNPTSTEQMERKTTTNDNDNNDGDDDKIKQQNVLQTILESNQHNNTNNKVIQHQSTTSSKPTSQSIIAKYLSTVTTMTKYMLAKGYIIPHEQSSRYVTSTEQYVIALNTATGVEITELLSNFKTEQKGTVCSFIDNPNAIIITELLFDHLFGTLTVPELAAVISIFVTGASTSDKSTTMLPKNIENAYKRIWQECADLDQLSTSFNKRNTMNDNDDDTTTTNDSESSTTESSTNTTTNNKDNKKNDLNLHVSTSLLYDTREMGLGMVLPVLTWCETHDIEKSISQSTTTIFPGNLSRTLHRLLNLLEQIEKGAEQVGDEGLLHKIEEVRKIVQSGTLFQSSLHLLQLQDKINTRQ